MPFQLICMDDPEKPGLRQDMRVSHLEYMIAHKGHILFGGPLKEANGEVSIGSAFALNYSTREEVDAFLKHEPYTQAGVFKSVAIHPIAVMVPEAHAGFLEKELQREKARSANSAVES